MVNTTLRYILSNMHLAENGENSVGYSVVTLFQLVSSKSMELQYKVTGAFAE